MKKHILFTVSLSEYTNSMNVFVTPEVLKGIYMIGRVKRLFLDMVKYFVWHSYS